MNRDAMQRHEGIRRKRSPRGKQLCHQGGRKRNSKKILFQIFVIGKECCKGCHENIYRTQMKRKITSPVLPRRDQEHNLHTFIKQQENCNCNKYVPFPLFIPFISPSLLQRSSHQKRFRVSWRQLLSSSGHRHNFLFHPMPLLPYEERQNFSSDGHLQLLHHL